MSKPKKAVGAPAHFQLFATMMILLLAFFIVLTSLTKAENDAGFQSNIGDIQNAFGIQGGLGMLAHYFTAGNDSRATKNSSATTDEGNGRATRYLRGSGGVGTNETKPDVGTPSYLRVVVPHAFDPGSDRVPQALGEYLDIAGTVLASYPVYRCVVRQATSESENWQANAQLAQRRAAAVRQYLNRSCALPLARVTAIGYADGTVLNVPPGPDGREPSQYLVFDLWRPADE